MLRLKELRNKTLNSLGKKLKQDDLAKEINVSRSTIAMWESGASDPDTATIKKLADYFNVTTDYLLGYDEEVQTTKVAGIEKKTLPPLTTKDERDIEKDLEEMINNLNSKDGMAGYNQIEDEEDLELLKSSLLTSMKLARQIAKKKFTPKKYQK